MNLGDHLLIALSLYGIPILAAALSSAAWEYRCPNALLLVASGSFAASGQMNPWTVMIVASVASIVGDVTATCSGDGPVMQRCAV
jgi:membrane protein DedA with SNARE-associated domain